MLNKLIIKNVALIDVAEISFTRGLNVLSGETGAGKSVILESINFVLGAKADKTLIRSGEEFCSVQVEFDVTNNLSIASIFDELEFDREDLLIITRKLSVDGKNTVKINGNTATVGMLKKFTQALVDVHGQSEHFALLKKSNQLELVDNIGGQEIVDIKEAIAKDFTLYKKVVSNLDSLGGDEASRLIKLDVLSYQINEIKEANIKDGEEEELLELKNKLLNHEKIQSALSSVKESVFVDGGASDLLSTAKREISYVSNLSEDFASIEQRLSSVLVEIRDIADTASSFLDDEFYTEYNLDTLEVRLETIRKIKKKYGLTIQAVNEFLFNAEKEKEKLENFNENAEILLKEKKVLQEKLYSKYLTLHNVREKCSLSFAKNVIEELKELNMPNANFKIDFSSLEDCSNIVYGLNGIDEVEFMFSANKGEPLKPLSMVISGGEMSRFMIGVKAQISGFNDISTFIFDEIDSGMSGNTASVVAKKFAKIAVGTQVIAISHLPQISAMADNNLLITKIEEQGKTKTYVKNLENAEKINEVARLVGGSNNETARKFAEELIFESNKVKFNN